MPIWTSEILLLGVNYRPTIVTIMLKIGFCVAFIFLYVVKKNTVNTKDQILSYSKQAIEDANGSKQKMTYIQNCSKVSSRTVYLNLES